MSDSRVPENVKFFELTEAQQAIVLMWYALKLPVEWAIERAPTEWHRERDHSFVLNRIQTCDNFDVHRRCCFRLART